MSIQDTQNTIVQAIKALPKFAAIPVFAADLSNIVKNTEQAIAKNHFCIVVDAAAFTDEAPDSAICYGTLKVEISVFEHIVVNRNRNGFITCAIACQALAKNLKLFNTGDGILTNPVISSPQNIGDGIISQQISFNLKTTL